MDLLDTSTPVSEAAAAMETADLRIALVEAAASIAAAQARLAQAMAVFRACDGMADGSGFSSFGQWASVDLGMTAQAATRLADAGDAVAERAEVRTAWEAGGLSTTKAQCVLAVADDTSEHGWCDLAREASATQLARIAAAYRRTTRDTGAGSDDETPDTGADAAKEAREADCGAWWRTRDDGLEELLAVLAPDDAAVVRAALESELEAQWRDRSPDATAGADTDSDTATDSDDHDDHARTFAPRPTATRRAEALVGLAANRLAAGTLPVVRGERTEVVLHVDEAFLRGDTDAGLCTLSNGPALDRADARRLACDARIRGLVRGADGSTVDLGRSQRLVSDKQRRLLTARDHGCRFPGCSNTRYVDAHHVEYWDDGGPTDMANLLLLCNRHHRLVHHGAFRIDADGAEGFTFVDRFDRPIRPPDTPARHRCRDVPDRPRARSGGDPRYSVDLAVSAMASLTRSAAAS